MTDIRKIAEQIVETEGGFVDDPDDPGGATKYGVTLGTLKRLNRDLTGDGKITVEDVYALTHTIAADIFLEHYFHRPKLDSLPSMIQPSLFDMYVNAGPRAVKLLQHLLNKMEFDVTVDGLIGPQTQAKAHAAAKAAPYHFSDAYAIERRNYYFRLADTRPSLRKFATTRAGGKGGWIKRAESFLAKKYHLSEEAFAGRTSQWD